MEQETRSLEKLYEVEERVAKRIAKKMIMANKNVDEIMWFTELSREVIEQLKG